VDHVQEIRAKIRNHERQIAFPDAEEVTGPDQYYLGDTLRIIDRLSIRDVS
jgi:hypothetical protein